MQPLVPFLSKDAWAIGDEWCNCLISRSVICMLKGTSCPVLPNSGYSFLRDHFRDSHYMCEEGECAHVEFTNAFRSDIDLKCHASTAHTGKMRKAQMRQARTLEIDFNLAPRHTHSRRDRDRDRDRDRGEIEIPDHSC